MKRTIEIGVGPLAATGARFVEAWHTVRQGAGGKAVEILSFEDMATFLTVMTPARWRLLRALRAAGPSSVRALAAALRRDYKNVHSDVRVLETSGLVTRDRRRRLLVPWDSLIARVDLRAA